MLNKINHFFLLLLATFIIGCNKRSNLQDTDIPFAIVIHGGAGNIKKESLDLEKQLQYTNALQQSLDAGYLILEKGGSAVEAVEAAIIVLEDSPLFNAGRGSVFNENGDIEMEAAIMDGQNIKAGCVTNVQFVKNPISLCKHILHNTDQFFLSGDGALKYARINGIPLESKEYFETEERRKKFEKAKKGNNSSLDHEEKMGTVGAVAIDRKGNICAGTSTGGLNNKKFGRIADSSIIGAGTYANNLTCGISCTGLGEYFIRTSAAHEVSALIKYKNLPLAKALHTVLFDQIKPLKGRGGMIGIDFRGNVFYDFTTTAMFRAYKSSKTGSEVKIFK